MKRIFPLSLVFLALALTVISASALGNVEDTGNFSSINRLVMDKDGLPATLSIAAIYAPNETYGVDYWHDLVCSGMTAGGCEYFKSNQAPELWASQIGHAADFVDSVTRVETITDVSEVWQARLTIFTSSKEKVEQDIFVLVERGADDRWYLNRVLHGPGIQP